MARAELGFGPLITPLTCPLMRTSAPAPAGAAAGAAAAELDDECGDDGNTKEEEGVEDEGHELLCARCDKIRLAADGTNLLVDAHCHTGVDARGGDWGQMLKRCRRARVGGLVVNATHEACWDSLERLRGEDDVKVYPQFGVHPYWVETVTPGWVERLEARLLRIPGAGVGEAGLHKAGVHKALMKQQEEITVEQLKLAVRLRRPVTLHCVRAHGRLLELLQVCGPFPMPPVLHSFSGSKDILRPLLQAGCMVSICGRHDPEVVAAIPWDRLLLESDSPDQIPLCCKATARCCSDGSDDPMNEPQHLWSVAAMIAEARASTVTEVITTTARNARKVFEFYQAN